MRTLALLLILALAACQSTDPDETRDPDALLEDADYPDDAELGVSTQAVAEACPYEIISCPEGAPGWHNGDLCVWRIQPGANLSDNWCPYNLLSSYTHLMYQNPPWILNCPGTQRFLKPSRYRASAASTTTQAWRSSWTSYESWLPTYYVSSSYYDGTYNRTYCVYGNVTQTLWFWRP